MLILNLEQRNDKKKRAKNDDAKIKQAKIIMLKHAIKG